MEPECQIYNGIEMHVSRIEALKDAQRCLVPELHEGDVVILDNSKTHDSEAVSLLIEGAGAHMIFLLAYSPDFNAIEQCFSKMKQSVRSAAARTRCKLHNAIVKATNAILLSDVKEWFEHAGYWAAPKCHPL
ncbi:MAG: transposase [Chthoniobacteraceae bacterium]|nr:transposase [Chthoniobacteraceae bacterium]